MPYHPFRHLGLKFVSLCLAVLLWLAVARQPVVDRSLRVPLQFQNIPEQMEIVGEPLRGSASIVSRLEAGAVAAVLDLGAARSGLRLFHLAPADVRVPFGVVVEQLVPATVSLEFERSLTRVVPVVPQIDGEPARGYILGPVTADPATVEVRGPESHVRRLTEATTEPVSVARATQTVRDVVTVGLSDSAVRLGTASSATVTAIVTAAPVERTLRDVPVRPMNLAARRRAEMSPVAVSLAVKGTRERVEGIQPGLVNVFVDLAGLGPGRYNLPVRTEPPEDVRLSHVEPPTIQVRIK